MQFMVIEELEQDEGMEGKDIKLKNREERERLGAAEEEGENGGLGSRYHVND